MLKNAGEMLGAKEAKNWATDPGVTVFEALQALAQRKVGCLVAVENDRVVGVFSERDYARKIVLEGRSSKTTRVREVMTTRVVYVEPDCSLEQCMSLMIRHGIRHLPVLDHDLLMGVISMRDVVKAVMVEKNFMIEQLEGYITGRRSP